MSCLMLKDIRRNREFFSFSQATPIDSSIVELAKERDDKKLSQGFSVTIGRLLVEKKVVSNHRDWHEHVGGVSRRTAIYQAARTLAHQYVKLVYGGKSEW